MSKNEHGSPELEEELGQSKKTNQMTSEECVQEAIGNIRRDRELASRTLVDVQIYAAKSKDRYEKLGTVAAKLLETLQRSNEQLVKIASLKAKKSSFDEEIGDEDKEDLFDEIQKEKDEGYE